MPPLGLLDRAKLMLQGRSAPAAPRSQYYRVACAEGHILHGQRTDGYQALRCPTCGEGIFVLPRSPLPEPPAPASATATATAAARRRSATASADEGLVLSDPPSAAEMAEARSGLDSARHAPAPEAEPEAEIEWADEDETPATPVQDYDPATSLEAAPAEPEVVPASRPPARPKPKPAAAPSRAPVPAGMVEVEERTGPLDWAIRRRNPLIFLAVALVLAATIATRVRRSRLEELPKVAELGRVEGLAKLDEGEFDSAKKILADAAAAVDGLGGQFEGADSIRQGAREAALFADRVRERLEDLVEEAAKAPPEDWPRRFEAIYKGRSILVEDEIADVPDPARPGSAYRLYYGIFFGRETRPAGRGRVSLDGFQLLEQARPSKGDHVLFGARLAAIRLDTASGEWLVELIPDSGSFITHTKAAQIIGLSAADPADEERGP